jgi:hypothetical protein
MDLHITISGNRSFTVAEELANFLISEFPGKVELTENPEQDQE